MSSASCKHGDESWPTGPRYRCSLRMHEAKVYPKDTQRLTSGTRSAFCTKIHNDHMNVLRVILIRILHNTLGKRYDLTITFLLF